MLNAAENRLMQQGEHARRRWERELCRSALGPRFAFASGTTSPGRSSGPFHGAFDFGAPLAALDRLWWAIESALSAMRLAHPSFPHGLARKAFAVGTVGVIATVAVASTLAVKGYAEHPAKFWASRIAERMVSPIYDPLGTLIGAVDTRGALTREQAANLAYIPLRGPVPQTFVKGLLAFENKHFYDGGIHSVCGIDVLSLSRPLTSLGRAGGSGLSQQLAKQLLMSEQGPESGGFGRAYRWAQQLGSSCSLYRTLMQQGGKDAVVTAYANYAPMWQGNGVLRGIEAAARVVFDVEPSTLTNAQQLLLAAAVKEPLRVLPVGAEKFDCSKVYPRVDNPQYESETARAQAERANQCRVIHRAISMAKAVLSGDDLAPAIEELRKYQRDGIVPVIDPTAFVHPAARGCQSGCVAPHDLCEPA